MGGQWTGSWSGCDRPIKVDVVNGERACLPGQRPVCNFVTQMMSFGWQRRPISLLFGIHYESQMWRLDFHISNPLKPCHFIKNDECIFSAILLLCLNQLNEGIHQLQIRTMQWKTLGQIGPTHWHWHWLWPKRLFLCLCKSTCMEAILMLVLLQFPTLQKKKTGKSC